FSLCCFLFFVWVPCLINFVASVPLKSNEVQLEVKDHVATVVSTLNYENKEDKPLEAVFVFPLPGDAAVCHFSAQIGQTHIVAEVKEKQQALEEYDDALSSGQQAFLLEESDQSPDIFSLSVGSLPPGESASIRLEYVTELAVQADDGLRFCLPTVLNPRYHPRAVAQIFPASLVPYSLSFSARVSSPRPISKVESNCSLEPLEYLNADQTQATVGRELMAAGHKFDRDVELLIYYKDAHQPTAVVEAGQASAKPGSLMGDPVVMVSLYPEFPQDVMSSLASRGEFVFLMDRSGSMNYTRISSARDTLLLLMKSLPMGCYFNIYSFGSRFEHIFPTSVEYSEKTMEEALKEVEKMEANLGGTEILLPLKHIYAQPCIPKQFRQVSSKHTGVAPTLMPNIVLTFGIGAGASSALINGMAKEGGGHAQFITGTDRMQPKVMQSLRFALQPAVEDISVSWDLPKGVSSTILSPPITAMFQGQRSLIYAQLTGQVGSPPSQNTSLSNVYISEVSKALKGLSPHKSAGPDNLFRYLFFIFTFSCRYSRASLVVLIFANEFNSRYVEVCFCSHLSKLSCFSSHVADLEKLVSLSDTSSQICLYFSFYVTGPVVTHEAASPPPRKDPLLQLVSLQKASGCWLLDADLAAALGKASEEVKKAKPASVNSEVWASILALIWLHGFKMDAKEEWELLTLKAASWIKAQNAPCVSECVEAGNTLLGCSVKKEDLGL
uniref:VIT domain-containing protein n=1 Tax=Fundulus heteroclitus TaxID=8078 RepID=A0A3Q2NN98_FUNHE